MSGALLTVRAVLRLPSLRRLVPAFLAFSIAEWASWIALVVYAYSRGGPSEAGLVAGVVFLPSIIVAPAASMFGDRWPRARVLTAAYAVVALAMGATAVALAVAPPIVAYLMATLAATSITLVRPAHAALLPRDRPDARRAGGRERRIRDRGGARGADRAAARGAAHRAGRPGRGLRGDRGPDARIGAAGPAAGPGRASPVVVAAAVPRRDGLLHELGAGLRAVVSDRRLFAVMAVLSGAIALLGAFNVFLTVIAIDLLGGDESTIGYVAAVAGLGSVVGAGATGFLMGRERLATVYVLAGALFAGAVVLIGLGPGSVVILACVVAAGVGWAFVYVEALTLAQRLAGDDVMSRVFGVMESTMMASQALGALAVPVLIALVGVMPAIVVSGLALGVVVAAAAPTLIRADRLVPSRVRQLRALRAVPMFGPLSAPVLERLATGATTVQVAAGEAIITAGEIGDRFYVILAGEVEVTTVAGVRRRQQAGDAFGEIALLRDIPRTATVTAIVPHRAPCARPRPVPRSADGSATQPIAGGRRDDPPARRRRRPCVAAGRFRLS